MKYKIGEIAEILGLTPEGIRYYEKIGIIFPEKDPVTGYRYYDGWDIHVLFRAKTYREFGFSLEEVRKVMNEYSSQQTLHSIDERQCNIEKEIIRQMNLLKYLGQIKEMIVDTEKLQGLFRLEYSPPMYRLYMQDYYDLKSDQGVRDQLIQWLNKAPYIFSSCLIPQDHLESGGKHFTMGLGISAELADYLNVKANQYVAYFPAKLCITTAVASNSDIVFSSLQLADTLAYIKAQGLKVDGDAVSRITLQRNEKNRYCNLHRFWIPVK